MQFVRIRTRHFDFGSFEVLDSLFRKAKGLLRDSEGRQVMLRRCSSIHTFCMRYPIDVAFVKRGGSVVLSERMVRPGRIVRARGASFVLERPGSDSPWPAANETLAMEETCDREGTCRR